MLYFFELCYKQCMSIERWERPDTTEFNRRDLESKAFEAQTMLDLLFLEDGNSKLEITHSRRGVPRMRAIIGDSDGWAENVMPAGIARLEDGGQVTYVVEQYSRRKGTFLWTFDPQTRQLDLDIFQGDSAKYYSSNNLPTGVDPLEDLEWRWTTLLSCVQGMTGHFSSDYEEQIELFPQDRHSFTHDALQDISETPANR